MKQKQEKELEIKYTFKPIINNSSSTSKNIQNKLNKFGSKIDIKKNNSYNNESKNEDNTKENKNLSRFENYIMKDFFKKKIKIN